jgi:uncharacterized damage-inducible protein DinB
MSRRPIVGAALGFVVSVVLSSIGIAQSSEPWLGTWRLNIEKSKSTAKSQIVRMESLPNGVRTIIDTVDAKDVKTHQEIVSYFDGKEYDVPAGIVLSQALHHGNEHRTQVCTVLTTLGVLTPGLGLWEWGEATGRAKSRGT